MERQLVEEKWHYEQIGEIEAKLLGSVLGKCVNSKLIHHRFSRGVHPLASCHRMGRVLLGVPCAKP